MSKKIPLYKKKDVYTKADEIDVSRVLEDLREEGVEDIESAYIIDEESEESDKEPEEEEQKVYIYRLE